MDFTKETWPVDYDGTPKPPSAGGLWWTAITMVVDNAVKLVPAVLIPAMLILSFDIFQVIHGEPQNPWERLAFAVLQATISSFFSITCFRIFLLGSDSVPWYGELGHLDRVIRYIGWLFFIGIVSGLISVAIFIPLVFLASRIGQAFVIFLIPIYFLLGTYISIRFMILLPATAVDIHLGFWEAWQMSGGKVGRMFRALFVVPLIALAPFLLSLYRNSPETDPLAREVVVAATGLAVYPVVLAVIAQLFQEIVGLQGNGASLARKLV